MNIKNKLENIFGNTITTIFKERVIASPQLVVITRIRNEELILEDTLAHLSQFGDMIVVYDDCSSDATYEIAKRHPKVAAIIRGKVWEDDPEKRIALETEHRRQLLEIAEVFKPYWIMCADADERFVGDIASVLSQLPNHIDGVRVQLFDAYITDDDQNPYEKSRMLLNFRKNFGPERRDIMMIWRNNGRVKYQGLDKREPQMAPGFETTTAFYCQHYGKSLSIQHWEDTCDYYAKHMPRDKYGLKWEQRKGKAVHKVSDSGRELREWGLELFANSIPVHP